MLLLKCRPVPELSSKLLNSVKMAVKWTENSCHRDLWKIMMDALPNIIPKSIIEVLNRLENDEDNRYLWKLMRNWDSLSLTVTHVSCKLFAKTPNKAKDNSEVAGRATVKPVRRRKKRNSPSVLARSRRKHARFLEK